MKQCKRFSVRKVKVGSYSRQGWLMSSREQFMVIDREWRKRPRGWRSEFEVKDEFMYVKGSGWSNRKFVEAIASYLNGTVGGDLERTPDGYAASDAVIRRDCGNVGLDGYSIWCAEYGEEK